MAITTSQLKSRRADAQKERDSFQPLLDEVFRYAIPLRKSTRNSGTGENRSDQVFDSTAPNAAVRFAGKYQQDIFPVGQKNFDLEPGPLVPPGKERERLAADLATLSTICQAFFEGDWDMAVHEMAMDLNAGTGCILMNPGSEYSELWSPISVPIDEVTLEGGANNKISGIFWDREMSFRVLQETWPDGEIGEDLKKLKPADKVVVHIDTVWEAPKGNRAAGRWRMIVWCDKQEARIFASESRTCPWLTPRYLRVPGETMGRGQAMIAMPEIKTLNTAKRLQLQAAAIAMLGIYTAVDDGVFNPDLSPLQPGIHWKVASNGGGSRGPSVQRFPDPRLDLSGMVVENMQMSVKEIMMDGALPVEGAAVKSPTEILERVKRLAIDHQGAFARQVQELTVPAVKRVIELAYNKGLIRDMPPIDQLLVKIKIKSPIALAREAQRVQRIIQWLEMVIAVTTSIGQIDGASRIAHIEKILTDAGAGLGIEPQYIVTSDERAKIDKDKQQQALLLAAASAAGAAPAAAAGA